jgi:uncharacterized protein YrzB (UPF0473 family)
MEKDTKVNRFTYIDEDGKKVDCDILFTFDLKQTGKNYIIFTDNTTDENGSIRTYAKTYEPGMETCDLGDIETEEEWKMIEGILSSLVKNM